jgi:exonuclease III
MRIVALNCCGRFAGKATELLDLEPDIAIVAETLRADAESLKPQGYESLWFGDTRQKGLAIIYKSPWTLQPGSTQHKWIVPITVSGPEMFTLIAVWVLRPKNGRTPDYAKVIRAALAKNPDWLTRGPAVMAGDFNSHWKWDREPTNDFASVVADLSSPGLLSAYHHRHEGSEGTEEPTFFQNFNPNHPHHIDYIFIPSEWRIRLKHFEVGSFDHWVRPRLSDHCPLTVEI